jgi:hypothetical protein
MSLTSITIDLSTEQIEHIDTAAAIATLTPLLASLKEHEQTLQFKINYPLQTGDPRELSEIPEVRLWFIRLDAALPCLPLFLDWKAGELARYVAMLVPHQFHPQDGIIYNPEALEIFVMQRTFVLMAWLQSQGVPGRSRVQSMTKMLGYELDDGFFELLGF